MRPSRRIAQRKITEQEAWHAAEFHQILGATHDHGGDAIRLKMPRDQTHGLMTHGSISNDHRHIRTQPPHMRQDIHAILLDGDFLAAIGGGADEFRRDILDTSAGRQMF